MVEKCPICEGMGLSDNKCRLCGAEREVSPRGHEMWVRGGSILRCVAEEDEAYSRAKEMYPQAYEDQEK